MLISSILLMSAGAQDAPAEKLICRRDYVVGSRVPKRVCLTKKQWEDADTLARVNKDNAINSADRNGRPDTTFAPKPLSQ
jgi:hypothetical protein